MDGESGRRRRRAVFRALFALLSLLFASDAPARGIAQSAQRAIDTPMTAAPRETRSASWAERARAPRRDQPAQRRQR